MLEKKLAHAGLNNIDASKQHCSAAPEVFLLPETPFMGNIFS